MKTTDYLDAVKRKLEIPSDYGLAKRWGVSKQHISAYRTGQRTFSDATAIEVARILGIAPEVVIADVHRERAKDEARSVWERIAKRVAAGVLVAIGAGVSAPSPTSAAPVETSVYYVKSRRRWLFPLIPPIDPGDELLT